MVFDNERSSTRFWRVKFSNLVSINRSHKGPWPKNLSSGWVRQHLCHYLEGKEEGELWGSTNSFSVFWLYIRGMHNAGPLHFMVIQSWNESWSDGNTCFLLLISQDHSYIRKAVLGKNTVPPRLGHSCPPTTVSDAIKSMNQNSTLSCVFLQTYPYQYLQELAWMTAG